MNRFCFSIAIVGAVLLVPGCSRSDDEAPIPLAGPAAEPESRLQHGANRDILVRLDAETQRIMGLRVAPLEPAELAPELKAFGQVLDAAPLAELVVELGRAQLEFDARHAELERMKVLKQQNNASIKAFQAAENAYQQSQTAAAAVRLKIRNGWGEKLVEMTGPMVVPVGSQRKLDSSLSDLVDGRKVLVQVELTAEEHLDQQPDSARLVPLSDDTVPVQAEYFDTTRTADPHTRSRGLLFLVETTRPRLVPGMALSAFVKTDGAAMAGVLLPRSAVVRFNGATWVYLQTGSDTFVRQEVTLDRPLERGWFVRGSLSADSKVVMTGAQQLLSEELKGRGDEE